MADQKLTDRNPLETSSASSLIHVVDNGTSYNQTKANFLKDVKGYAGDIDVSAIWTSGLSFDVTADSYIVNNTQYSSTSGTVTLDTADATLDRIDLIVAVAPVSPATVGTVGKISGTPASPTVVVPPDYASDSVYVIKQVLVKAAQTEPFGTSKTVVFDEGAEWTVTYPTGFSLVSSGAYNGTNCIFGDNVSVDEKITFTSGSPYTYNDVDLITFYIKSTNPSYWNGTNNLSIRFLNSGTLFKSVSYNDQNGIYNEWNKVSISKDLLGLKDGTFNQIQIVPSVGLTYSFLLDIIEIHQGSGSEPNNLISQWYNDVGYVTEGFDEFIESTGTRAGGDLVTTIGDYDDTGTSTKIEIDDVNEEVNVTANVQFSTNGTLWAGSYLKFGGTKYNPNVELRDTGITAARTFTLPNASGTIALTSDIDTFAKLDAIVADKTLVNLEQTSHEFTGTGVHTFHGALANVGSSIAIKTFANGGATHPIFDATASQGTIGARTYLLNGNEVGAFVAREGTSGSYAGGSGMRIFASENWDASSLGADLYIFTVPNGSTTKTTFITLKNDGKVGIGNEYTSPSEALDVDGNIKATGNIYADNGTNSITLQNGANPYVVIDDTDGSPFGGIKLQDSGARIWDLVINGTEGSLLFRNASNVVEHRFYQNGNYVATGDITGSSIIKDGGTSSQILIADGSVASLIDDDTLATATATNIASAESIKAYVDASGGDYVTLTSPQSITGTKTIDNVIIDNYLNITSNGYIKIDHDTGFSSGANGISLNANENLFIISDNDGTTTRTVKLDLGDLTGTNTQSFTDAQGIIPLKKSTVPTSATDTGVVGQIAYNSSYFYVCTATNTWVRTALATW